MSEPSPESQWSRACAGVTRAQFELFHPHAFLLRTTPPGEAGQRSFHTQVHGAQARYSLQPAAGLAEHELIFPLIKAPGNPFPERISVGRAPNCDVVIHDPSVSKLHGHFRDVTQDAAVFMDAKSANGTRVDGLVVPPGTVAELKKTSHIIFGRIQCVLLGPGDVYDHLCP